MVLLGPTWSYLVLFDGPTWSYVVLLGPMWSYLILFDGPTWSCLVLCGPTWSYLVLCLKVIPTFDAPAAAKDHLLGRFLNKMGNRWEKF